MSRWHEILGVSKDAPAREVQAAFRRLTMEHHPERHPGDPAAMERFRAINAAYQEWQVAQGAAPAAYAPPRDDEENARVLEQVRAAMEGGAAQPGSRAGAVLLYGALTLMLVAFLVALLGRASGCF